MVFETKKFLTLFLWPNFLFLLTRVLKRETKGKSEKPSEIDYIRNYEIFLFASRVK